MEREINVSRNGIHLFATHARSLSNHDRDYAIRLAKEIQSKFPDCKVKLTEWWIPGKTEVEF